MKDKFRSLRFGLGFCIFVLASYPATAQTLVATPSHLTFRMQADSMTLPASQTMQITSPRGNIPFFIVVSPSAFIPPDPIFLSVDPSTGATPATVTISLMPKVLPWGYGGYYNTVGIGTSAGEPGFGNVSLLVDLPPPPVVKSVLNAASLKPGISPGTVVTILGDHIGPAFDVSGGASSVSNRGFFFSTILGYSKVTFNGVAGPMLYAAAGQINTVVPYEIAGKETVEIVAHDFIAGPAVTLPVMQTSPAVFTLTGDGTGQGAILNQNNTINGSRNPAAAGSIIQIFATGAGLWTPAVETGIQLRPGPPFPVPIAPVSVSIGGQPAEISYAGGAPGRASGLLQVNAVVPPGLASGPQPVLLTIGQNDNSQQLATVEVQ